VSGDDDEAEEAEEADYDRTIADLDPGRALAGVAPVPDAASASGVQEQARTARRAADETLAFWRGVLASRIGRHEIFKLLANAHTFEDRFASTPVGFPDRAATFFQLGEKAVGTRLYHYLAGLDRALVLQMLDEADMLGPPKPQKAKRVRK